MNDWLKDSPAYHWMTDDALQEGLERGHEEGLAEGQLKGYRSSALAIVTNRFPKLTRLAQTQLALIEDTELLQRLVVNFSIAQTASEIKQYLWDAVKDIV